MILCWLFLRKTDVFLLLDWLFEPAILTQLIEVGFKTLGKKLGVLEFQGLSWLDVLYIL